MEEKKFYGLWGNLRLKCLREYHPEEYQRMVDEGSLENYLREFNEYYSEKEQVMCDQIIGKHQEENKGEPYGEYMGFIMTTSSQVREIIRQEISEL